MTPEEIGRFPGIEQAVLFGSRAKGNYRPGSDIELVLDDLLPWKIDLSLYSQIDNPALVEHMGRVGRVFYL